MTTVLPCARRGLSRAPVFWAFISTLDRPLRADIIEAGTKRNAVQWSFVPWQDSFAMSDQDSSPGILDGTSYSTSHLFDRQTKTMIHVSNSPTLFHSKGEAGRSINFPIGLRLPRDVPGYPACEPAAPGCCACAISSTAVPPTSGRWPLSPPPCRDGTSTVDSPAVILRHSAKPFAAASTSKKRAIELPCLLMAPSRCRPPLLLARGFSPR